MAIKTQESTEFRLGAKVRIKNYPGPPGKVVELSGPFGPNGMQIYRVAIPESPGYSMIEVRANQLEAIPSLLGRAITGKLRKIPRSKKRIIRRPRIVI